MSWRRLTLTVQNEQHTSVAAALLEAVSGSRASIEQRAHEKRIRISVYLRNGLTARASKILGDRVSALKSAGCLEDARLTSAAVHGVPWATAWRKHFRPALFVPGLYVVPSWESDFRPPAGSRTIRLDPGMAFGTGQHASTRLAARLMLPLARPRIALLDIGCGSGILALAGARWGARVYACDADPVAVEATRANFKSNALRAVAIRRACSIPQSFPRSELVVANITADVLAAMAVEFRQHLSRRGALITSGITARGRRHMLSAFRAAGLRPVKTLRAGEWFAYMHVKE